MKTFLIVVSLSFLPAGVFCQEVQTNSPPKVELTFPPSNYNILGQQYILFKAAASDADGAVAYVQFFAGTNLVGVATNVPYSVFGWIPLRGEIETNVTITAMAVDDRGAKTESESHRIRIIGVQPRPLMTLVSPADREMFLARATFDFSTELLLRADPPGFASPTEFYIGTNLLKRIEKDPYSVTVTNLVEGEYALSVRYRGGYDFFCTCPNPITIRVTNLGIRTTSLASDGHLQFDAVTAFPGKETVVQTSLNLRDWTPISTNVPSTNTFQFVDPNPLTPSERFYRVVVPP